METKVKGEVIKEGSIPLSALASGNYMLNNYGVNDGYLVAELTSNNTYFNIYEDKNVVYISATNHNIIELVKGQKTTLSRGPGATITYDNNGIKIDRSYDFYNVKVYREIEHISPDWNAQAGEAGYIENRTHYNIENTILQKIDDKDLGDINIKGYDRIHIIYDYKNGETDYIIIDVKNKYIIDSTLENWKNGYVDYHFNDDSFSLYVDDYDYDVLPNINVIGYITKQLDEVYIPDTIARKSEVQNIDPVVWKYMCEPYVFHGYEGLEEIPEDLANIIIDDPTSEDPSIKDIAFKCIVILNEAADRVQIQSISGSGFCFEGDGNTGCAVWDPSNRAFSVHFL